MARARILAPLIVLLAVLVLVRAQPGPIVNLRNQVFDQLQRGWPRPWQDAGVRVIDIDDASLAKIGQWPWPRRVIAELVMRVHAEGAAALAFDVVFAEPDRMGPEPIARAWPDMDPAIRAELETLPDPDALLAEQIATVPTVTGFFLVTDKRDRAPTRRYSVGVKTDAASKRDPLRRVPSFPGAVPSIAELEKAAQGNGSLNGRIDPDGVHRRVPLVFRHGDAVVPGLGLEALRVAVGSRGYVIRAENSDEDLGISSIAIPPHFEIPTDPEGAAWIHFTDTPKKRVLPAWRVLAGEIPPGSLEGAIAFVGTSAIGLKDQRATPLDPALPGVMLHAELVEQILLEHHLERPGFALGLEWTATALLGLIVLLLVRFSSALVGAGVLVLASLAAIGASAWAFTELSWLFDPVTPTLGVLAVFLVGSVLGHLSEESQRRRVRGAFGHYLAPALVAELARDPARLQLGGEMRELSFLFCDVRGFTSLSEKLDPEALTQLVNRLLTPLSEAILQHSGTIDKYMGDCVMAFWNAPLDVPDHARLACEAALAMNAALALLNEELECEEDNQIGPLRVGIGINTGQACVGNLGSEQRFDYSVIGDAVNLASRLEGQSKTYGVDIILGDETCSAVPELATLELDLIRVRGKQEAVRIHALVGDASYAETPAFLELRAEHSGLLKAYRSCAWLEALERCEICAEAAPELEGLYKLIRERIECFRVDSPPKEWDGVFTATSK
ncbi:MAG: adenylate/guanylate cyclase domain-containing protein [bacterium]|nr:adenylate/guanylate cyclase domain-containing protein [bacterium]MCP5071292.1 adenylate/guanylate cyclase domain-containing protein [bacterium]